MQTWGMVLLLVVPLVFGLVGGRMAARRGRNMLLWGVLSAVFPIFIMIVYFEKPAQEVPGGFKRCGACAEWIKWEESPCHYCAADQPPR
jgi:hypothetical protein